MIETRHLELSVKAQCKLLDFNRSSYYYVEKLEVVDSLLIEEIIQLHIQFPFMGTRRLSLELKKKNYQIGRKKTQTLMEDLKIKAIYPKPNLSMAIKEHKKFPYLLKDLKITHANQVWSTDITYIRTKQGFMYLTAVIDVYSRYIIAWELSNSLAKDLCTSVMEKALKKGKPEIVNTDQGSQYTSNDFVDLITVKNKIQLSMDSKGRALDNIWIERFWRTVKYEEIYLKEYKSIDELYSGIKEYIDFYNNDRGHQTLKYATPSSLYPQRKPSKTKAA